MPLFGKKEKNPKKAINPKKDDRSPTFQDVQPLVPTSKDKEKNLTFSQEVAHVDWFHPELTREGAEVKEEKKSEISLGKKKNLSSSKRKKKLKNPLPAKKKKKKKQKQHHSSFLL